MQDSHKYWLLLTNFGEIIITKAILGKFLDIRDIKDIRDIMYDDVEEELKGEGILRGAHARRVTVADAGCIAFMPLRI